MPAEQRAMLHTLLGRDHAEALPARQRAWEAERDALAEVLVAYGVEVLRPRLLTRWEKQAGGTFGYCNSFVRDPWFTVGPIVIEGALRFPHRRNETLPSRDILRTRVLPAECVWVAMPQPEILPLNLEGGAAGPFLEGGDVLVLDKQVFVGQSGRGSSSLGAAWLQKLLAPHGFTVETIRLKPNLLHLDCAFGLVREGLMVVCEEAFLDGLPRSLHGWDRIDVTEAEAMALGTNGLPISPQVYVTDPVFGRIGAEIARHGVEVIEVDFAISRSFGGGFRCSTQPLHRE